MERNGRWLTHNGEIYNFIELRRELAALGEHFTTTSDTEVLLAAHRVWGDDAVPRLNGMWAFALWDPARGLLLSRDRLGVKPLFIARGARCVHFGSEIKALLGFPCVSWRPDLGLLHRFVVTGTTVDGSRATFFRGIDRVPPATLGWIDPGTLQPLERRFWSLTPDSAAAVLSFDDATTRLEELVRDAVRIRLRSDVPVGITLSGGIDSSTIAVSLPQDGTTDPAVRAFSVRWSGDEGDESSMLRLALAASQLEGKVVEAHPDELHLAVDELVWHQDEPFAHTAPFGQWLVYELAAREGVHVVLEGQGADELFGGYQSFAFGGRFADLARHASLPTLIKELAAFRSTYAGGLGRASALTLMAAVPTRWRTELRRSRWRSWSLGRTGPEPSSIWAAPRSGGVLRRGLIESLTSTSLPALLRYADRSSMAHSVEVRLPFLDHRVVSFALGLRDEMLVGAGRTKRVLREVLRRRIPDLADQPAKYGFTAPEAQWIRGPLRSWVSDLVTALERRDVFPRGALEAVSNASLAGRAPAQVAWRMAVAESWLRRYADAAGREP